MKSISLLTCLILSNWIFSQNTVCFQIEENPNASDPALSGFTKYINVLDCFEIYAEPSISDDKVLHAAAVTAELLDNDEDGVVDDPLLKTELASSMALMPLFSAEGSATENTFMDNYNGDGVSAVLYNQEIDPSQPGHWGDDATVEEILHTINHVGHSNIYPDAFAFEPNSSYMTSAMDIARGGQFLTIPSTYPEEAWYHYDDQTCDYGCMSIEYIYWSIVSNMGILNDPSTCSGIMNEWETCSPELFESTDVAMYALITDPQYKLPQQAPDGNYCPSGLSIEGQQKKRIEFQINTSSKTLQIQSNEKTNIELYDLLGHPIWTKNQSEINYSYASLSPGIYLLKIDDQCEKIILN